MVEPNNNMNKDLTIETDSILREMNSLDKNKKIITISKLGHITDCLLYTSDAADE